MSKARPVEIRPAQGGRLMTVVSAETCGVSNWQIKRDWRRFLDREVRSEGYDRFAPNPAAPDMPPTADPITIVAYLRRQNGALAVVVGTQTTLWRYFGLDDPRYVATGYSGDGYESEVLDTWVQIGGQFLDGGRRWEACSLNGYLILNNGADLPVTYRVEEMAVKPIYELRENGISKVGTIAVDHDILVCGDITQIREDRMKSLLGGDVTITDTGYLHLGIRRLMLGGLTPGITYTLTTDVIGTVSFVAGGSTSGPYDYIDINSVAVSPSGGPYGRIDDSEGITDRYQWRVIWSLPNEPRRFGAVVNCATQARSLVVTLKWPSKSLEPGQDITIIGAGPGGGNLSTRVMWVNGTSVNLLDLPAATLDDTELFRSDGDPTNTITGKFEDLQNDGTAILRMMTLRRSLVIYKEASIYIATYTGNILTPWAFDDQEIPPETALFHRDTLVSLSGAGHVENGYALGGAAHIYAGRNQFYRFDLTNLVPMEIPELRDCQDIFFSAASVGQVFASVNPLTKEVFFCFPNGPGPDYAIRFDYRFGTCSTTSMVITAASQLTRPERAISSQGDMWFVMGSTGGNLFRYGLLALQSLRPAGITITKAGTTATASGAIFTSRMVGCSLAVPGLGWWAVVGYTSPTQVTVLAPEGAASDFAGKPFSIEPAIYHRDGQAYDSVLQSGLGAFFGQAEETQLERYAPVLASHTRDGTAMVQTPLAISLRTAVNPSGAADTITTTIQKPLTQNMVTATVLAHYLGDRITVSGANNPSGLVCRIFDVFAVMSRGFVRRQ